MRQALVALVAAVRPETLGCVARKRFVITSSAAHEYKSNLKKTVQAAVREFYFFNSVSVAKTWHKQARATSPNVSCIPLVCCIAK